MIKRLNPLSTFIELMVNRDKAAGLCVACLSPDALDGLCTPCRNDLPANRWCCRQCALPLPFSAGDAVCGECVMSPPPFSRTLTPFRYQFPVDGMISRYKYNRQHRFARPLIASLSQHLKQANPVLPDALIPVPAHPQRRRKRGFNQAQDIAEHVGRALGIPVAAGIVKRKHTTRSQRELNREQRLTNLQGAFDVCAQVPERIAIVDDVVTTGATVRALSSSLESAGARDIQIWALARTPG